MVQSIEVEIESLTPSGDGVARAGRLRVLVPFTIPGERARVQIARRRGTEVDAVLDEIVAPSPHRVAAPCPHFGPCGGCTWQHIAYPHQLILKRDLVTRLVGATLRRPPDVRDTMPATPLDDPWGYRHKVHFVFGNASRRGPLIMGHYARGSRRVVPVRVCPVHDPRGNAFAFRLRDECARAGVSAAGPASGRDGDADRAAGTLRHLTIRVGARSAEMMATLVVTRADDKRLRAATRRAMSAGNAPESLHLNLHPRHDAYVFGRETRRLTGSERMREDVGATSFLISPTAFFQTNVHAAELLVRLVLEAVPPGARVLDLYAGAGLFAIPLARRGNRVIAIEESRAAVDDGTASLRLNRVQPDSCRFVARRVESAIKAVEPEDSGAAVLDPPREGCTQTVLDELFGRLRPQRAVYVSCNPEALARDLAVAERHSYRAEALQPVDMFPHTAHIETVAVLTRRADGTR